MSEEEPLDEEVLGIAITETRSEHGLKRRAIERIVATEDSPDIVIDSATIGKSGGATITGHHPPKGSSSDSLYFMRTIDPATLRREMDRLRGVSFDSERII